MRQTGAVDLVTLLLSAQRSYTPSSDVDMLQHGNSSKSKQAAAEAALVEGGCSPSLVCFFSMLIGNRNHVLLSLFGCVSSLSITVCNS